MRGEIVALATPIGARAEGVKPIASWLTIPDFSRALPDNRPRPAIFKPLPRAGTAVGQAAEASPPARAHAAS
jgi:hypothetical protein